MNVGEASRDKIKPELQTNLFSQRLISSIFRCPQYNYREISSLKIGRFVCIEKPFLLVFVKKKDSRLIYVPSDPS